MNEAEIAARIKELKAGFESDAEAKLAKFARHKDILRAIEEEFGFDLDIATEIYGDQILDPLQAECLLEKWAELLTEIKNNPGGDLLVVRQVQVSTGIHSIAHDPNIKYTEPGVELALVRNVKPENIVYVAADPKNDTPAYIAVQGEVTISYPAREHESMKGLLQPPGDKPGLILAQKFDPTRLFTQSASGIGSPDISFIYDPSLQNAQELISSKIEDSLFPVHFLDLLDKKPTAKS